MEMPPFSCMTLCDVMSLEYLSPEHPAAMCSFCSCTTLVVLESCHHPSILAWLFSLKPVAGLVPCSLQSASPSCLCSIAAWLGNDTQKQAGVSWEESWRVMQQGDLNLQRHWRVSREPNTYCLLKGHCGWDPFTSLSLLAFQEKS